MPSINVIPLHVKMSIEKWTKININKHLEMYNTGVHHRHLRLGCIKDLNTAEVDCLSDEDVDS